MTLSHYDVCVLDFVHGRKQGFPGNTSGLFLGKSSCSLLSLTQYINFLKCSAGMYSSFFLARRDSRRTEKSTICLGARSRVSETVSRRPAGDTVPGGVGCVISAPVASLNPHRTRSSLATKSPLVLTFSRGFHLQEESECSLAHLGSHRPHLRTHAHGMNDRHPWS